MKEKNDKKNLKNEKKTKEKEKNKNEKKEKNQQHYKNTEKSSLTVGPAVRSPKSASWALWTKSAPSWGSYKGCFVSFITVIPCAGRASNGPIMAGDKPSGFLPFQVEGPFTFRKKVPKRFFF